MNIWDRWTITLCDDLRQWRFHANGHSYWLWAQNHRDQWFRRRGHQSWRPRARKNWAWQESWDISVSNPRKICEKFSYWRYRGIWKKLVLMCLTSSHRCIPNSIRRKALQTRTLKMENYEKCWLHHCLLRIEKTMNLLECQSHRCNLLHCVHLERKNREINSKVLCSQTLTRQLWKDLSLKAVKIICSTRQDQTWRSKNFMSSPSIGASVNYNDKRKRKDWHCRTHNTDLFETRREQVGHQ